MPKGKLRARVALTVRMRLTGPPAAWLCDQVSPKSGEPAMCRLAMWVLLLVLAADSGVALAQDKAEQDKTHVFVDGALSVPGAPKDGDTVPSKFSARNAASDRLPIVAFR